MRITCEYAALGLFTVGLIGDSLLHADSVLNALDRNELLAPCEYLAALVVPTEDEFIVQLRTRDDGFRTFADEGGPCEVRPAFARRDTNGKDGLPVDFEHSGEEFNLRVAVYIADFPNRLLQSVGALYTEDFSPVVNSQEEESDLAIWRRVCKGDDGASEF